LWYKFPALFKLNVERQWNTLFFTVCHTAETHHLEEWVPFSNRLFGSGTVASTVFGPTLVAETNMRTTGQGNEAESGN
jgi:hypothetical protein